MATHRLSTVLQRLRENACGSSGSSDRQLLARFVAEGSEPAFQALLARHGAMVLNVCRRVLGDHDAAEDAFQATFLVLARRAASIRRSELLSNWLYGVACRTALKARVTAAKRRAREQAAPPRQPSDAFLEISVRELFEVLDRELQQLPDEPRAALIACFLEGLTRDEAARQLGWSLATLGRRLEHGRELLRLRLARQGLAPALVLFPAALATGVASAAVPAALAKATVQAALSFGAGETAAAANVLYLAERVLTGMSSNLFRISSVVVAALVFVAAGAGVTALARPAASGAEEPVAKVADLRVNPLEVRGTWVFVEEHKQGTKIIADNVWLDFPKLVITERTAFHWSFREKSLPAAAEFNQQSAPKRFHIAWDQAWNGIYAVEGDLLKLCFDPDTDVRPADFTTPLGSKRRLLIYRRVAPENENLRDRPAAGPGGDQPGTVKERNPLWSVSWSADGKRLASGGYDGKVRQWEPDDAAARALPGHHKAVTFVAWSPDSERLASAGQDGTIRLWSAAGKPGAVIEGHTGLVACVAWSPDGKHLASAGFVDRTVRLWSADGTPGPVLKGHTGEVHGIAWSADGKHLASASYDGTVRLWSSDGKPGAVLKAGAGQVFSVAWQPGNNQLASGHQDGTIRLWAADGTPGKVLRGHEGYVAFVCWRPDGKQLASASADKTVRVWQAEGKQGHVLKRHTDTVHSVAWNDAGTQIFSGGMDGLWCLWDAKTGKAVRTIDDGPQR